MSLSMYVGKGKIAVQFRLPVILFGATPKGDIAPLVLVEGPNGAGVQISGQGQMLTVSYLIGEVKNSPAHAGQAVLCCSTGMEQDFEFCPTEDMIVYVTIMAKKSPILHAAK